MKYQPGLYLPAELGQYIECHLKPIEESMRNVLAQESLRVATQESLTHNLKCLADFRQKRDVILERYRESCEITHGSALKSCRS